MTWPPPELDVGVDDGELRPDDELPDDFGVLDFGVLELLEEPGEPEPPEPELPVPALAGCAPVDTWVCEA